MTTRVVQVLGAVLCGLIAFVAVRVGIYEPKPTTAFHSEAAMWLQECEERCPKGTKAFVVQGGASEENFDDWRCGCMKK